MKTCNRCSILKPLTDFYKRLDKESRCKMCVSSIRKATYAKDRDKVLARVAKYRTDNPEIIRDTKLKQAYGVGVAYFDAKVKEQGGTCAGCKRDVKTIWRGKEVKMALDHDHKTLSPRGVLCIKCNRALGLIEESVETLANLAEYIQKYQKLG